MHLCALLNPQHDQKDTKRADSSKYKLTCASEQTIRGKHDITDIAVPRTVLETVSVCSVRTKQKYTYPKKYLRKIAQLPPYSGGVTDADSSALFSKITNQEIEIIKRDSRGLFTQTKHYATIQQDLREDGKWLVSQQTVSYSRDNAARKKSHPVVTGKRQFRPTTRFLDYVAQESDLPSHTGPKPSRVREKSMDAKCTSVYSKCNSKQHAGDYTVLPLAAYPQHGSPQEISSKHAETRANGTEQSFEIAAILGKRNRGNVTEYCTQWQGYDISQATWEPLQNFESTELIKEFEQHLKKKRRAVST
jgi:hypothetical protein